MTKKQLLIQGKCK